MTDTPVFSAVKSWDDAEPLGADVAPDKGDGYQCIICGTSLTRSTKGPAPKYCDAHKNGKGRGDRTASPGTGPARAGVSEAAMTRINVGITTQVLSLGRLIRNVEPFDGSVIVNQSEEIGQACETISRRDPKFRKACEDYLNKTGYIELAVLAMSILTPIAAHHGLMPGKKLPPAFVEELERRHIANASVLLDEYNMRNIPKVVVVP